MAAFALDAIPFRGQIVVFSIVILSFLDIDYAINFASDSIAAS